MPKSASSGIKGAVSNATGKGYGKQGQMPKHPVNVKIGPQDKAPHGKMKGGY